jgi:hypothetical protein
MSYLSPKEKGIALFDRRLSAAKGRLLRIELSIACNKEEIYRCFGFNNLL